MRKTAKGTLLVGVALIASAVALIGGGAASSAAVPVEMNFACALKSNGLMRYVTNLNQCKSTETAVTIKPGPVYLCIQPDGSVRRVTSLSNCSPPPAGRTLTLPPTSGTVYFCAYKTTGVLRYVQSPSQCTSKENPVYVTPNDAAPAVTTTSPANGATNVAVNTNVVVNFNESVTVSTSSFTLICGGNSKTFTVTGSPGTAITLDPTVDLPQGTSCTVTAVASNISDTDTLDPPDNPAANYSFSFTTDSAPTVSSTSPANGATGVNASNNVTVTFSEPVNASGSSFTIECPSGSAQTFAVSGSGTSTITLNPDSDLPASTTCTVTVLASGITDVDGGDPPDNLAANYVFSFTTSDAAPSVTSTSPANGADHVAVNANVVVNFSEPVTASGSSFTLECPTGSAKSFSVSGSPGSAITLDPTADLPEGTTCTVTVVAANISDVDAVDPPDNMAANYVFSFTTDSAPAVTSHSPADGATDVAANTNITFTFSEAVTVDSSSFTISCDGNPQTFQVSGSGTSSITLDPDSDLPTANCTVTAVAANISDVDGGDPPDHPAANTSFSFATQDAAPTVTSTSPADAADRVAVNSNVVVNFSEPVTATTSSFTLDCPAGTPQSFTVSGSPGSSITLDPTSNLPEGTICSVTVVAANISDVDSVDPPDNMAANYPFSFTTDSAPAVTTTSPADNATDVDPSANIVVNFNEAVDVTTSSFTISCDGNPQTFGVTGSGTTSITLDPDSDLPDTASCTVTAVAANISDSDTGDPPDHPAANSSFSFTTQDAAPSVTSTSPADGAVDVAKTANIDVTFSEPVTATGSSFTLECPTGSAQAFTVSGSPGSTITLNPDADLPNGTVCTVTVVAANVSDVDSVDPPDNMAANFQFSFTVVANQAPTDINLSNSSVDENQPSGTTVGTLSTTDPDAGDTHTYALVSGTGDTDNGSFTITGDTLKTNATFDFETKSSYSIRVQSTDSGSLTFEKVFTISVNNVNEAPTDIQLSNNDIDENQPSATTIGALTATDPDTGQTHTFSLANSGCSGSFPDNSSFQIVGGDLKSAVSFNFEVKSSYTICVRTTDNGSPNLSFDKQFTITINDVNDAPVAVADGPYNGVIGNTLAVLGTTGSGPKVVLTGNVITQNDTDEDATFPHTLSAVAETPTSTGGGTATINTDGSFTFLPGVGDKNQNDTFTYHVTDGSLTTAGTVTVHIEDFLVWYVNNASAAASHDGRSPSPFLNLASLNAAGGSGDSDGTGDYIFLYQGSGSYGGGIPLEANQKLYGEKHGLTVNSVNLVAAGATAPVVTNASGTGVGLASGVDVQGLNISGTSGDAINGVAVTTATVGTTTAVNISSAGGDGVDLSGAASGNISIASPITGSAGHSVSVAGRTGGTVAFSGAISDTGTGILLNGNTGATINLTGGVTASTGASNAFAATGGGTVNVPGANNTLATTTGTALNVTSTNIGSSGLTFKSIAANGAANGIVLNGTGSSGGLTVTGDGSNTSLGGNATGGTITNSTGADGTTAGTGVYLNNTSSVSLRRMTINGTNQNFGIRGSGVNGLTLEYSTVGGTNGTSTGLDEGSIIFDGLTGTATFTKVAVSGTIEDNFRIRNSSGTSNVTIDSSTFTNAPNDNLIIEPSSTSTVTAHVTNNTFTGTGGDHFQTSTTNSATLNVVFTGNLYSNGFPGSLGGGVTISGGNLGSSEHVNFNVSNNGTVGSPLIGNVQGGAINVNEGQGGGTWQGQVASNIIGNAAVAGSGSTQASGIRVENHSTSGTLTAIINANTVRQWGTGPAINTQAGDAGNASNSGVLNVTVTNNTATNPGALTQHGFVANIGAGDGDGTAANVACVDPRTNTLDGNVTNGGAGVRVRQREVSTVRIPGYTGTQYDTTSVANYLQTLNPASVGPATAQTSSAGPGFTNTSPAGSACAQPTVPS